MNHLLLIVLGSYFFLGWICGLGVILACKPKDPWYLRLYLFIVTALMWPVFLVYVSVGSWLLGEEREP